MAEQQDERSIPSFPFVSNPAPAMKHLGAAFERQPCYLFCITDMCPWRCVETETIPDDQEAQATDAAVGANVACVKQYQGCKESN